MEHKQPPSVLEPVKVEQYRQNFSDCEQSENILNAIKFFKPIIHQFEKFAVGPFFWFMVDLVNWTHPFGGGAIEQLTPLKTKDFINGNPKKLHDITYPDDLPRVMAFSNYWINYHGTLTPEKRNNVKMTMYFRLQNKQNKYSWIMVQYPDGIKDINDTFIYGLVIVTDISHVRNDGEPLMSILDTYNGECQHFICIRKGQVKKLTDFSQLTKREIDVLRYLAIGYSSKQIASELCIAIKTVDNHRQKMLHKTQTKSSAELIHYCIKIGYL